MRRHSSLEAKLCFLVSGLIFALLLAVGHVQMESQRSALTEAKVEKYQSLSNALALAYAPSNSSKDETLYRQFVDRLMQADEDISYVVISDSNGNVLFADTHNSHDRTNKENVGRKVGKIVTRIQAFGMAQDSSFRKITIPTIVGQGKRGTVTIGFGSDSIQRTLEELDARLLCTFALAFLVGIIASISLARAIAYPLHRLVTAAIAVENGDLEVSIPSSSTGEVGELESAFNRMVVALRESRDKLIQRANTDSLTGLFNHQYFQERLRSELKRAERYGRPLALIMLDIDHFKTLNDTHGHPVGDAVLVQMAQILLAEVRRDIDIVARYGGEEFAVILPETEDKGAEIIAERLRVAIQRHCFTGKGGETIPITISLGVAQYPVHSSEREGLIMAADLAMYQSKSMGRNRTTVFSNDSRVDANTDPYKLYLLLHATDMSTIEAMAAAVDAKGQRLPGFSKAVVADSVALAEEMGLPEKEQNDVRVAALLHDIGKLGISDTILNKKEALTDEEKDVIKSHPVIGYAIVQRSTHLKPILPGILYHHERWDGEGYPHGLKGKEIPLIARVIAVADSYHAMMTERPHCGARTEVDAREELRRCSGTQFDPAVVESFLRVLDRAKSREEAA